MHSYVVIVTKPGRRRPHDLVTRLARADLIDVPFVPDHVRTWTNDLDTVAYVGWQTATDVFEVGSHWSEDHESLTAFTGQLWPKGRIWADDEDWASQLARIWPRKNPTTLMRDLGGIYTCLQLEGSGRGHLLTDPLSICPLFHSENDDVVVYSSRAALAARATARPGTEPDRDALSVGWLAFRNYIMGDGTGFVGTHLLPAGSYVEIDPRFGSRVRYFDPQPWLGDLPTDQDELVEMLLEELTDNVRSVARLPARVRRADLTGGKDTRLLLSLMERAGVTDRFRFRTIGPPHLPDVSVAHDIAREFDLDIAHEAPTPMAPELFRSRLGIHVYQTSGGLNSWDLHGGTGIARRPTVTGCYGEVQRTNFGRHKESATVREALTHFFRESHVGRSSLLGTAAQKHYSDQVATEIYELTDGGITVQDRMDRLWFRHGIRRWSGSMEELNPATKVHPLCTLLGAQAAFAVGGAARRTDLLHFEVMVRASRRLATLPFAGSGWSPRLYEHRDDAADFAAPPVQGNGREVRPWQMVRLEACRSVVEELLLEDPPDELWEVFSKHSVRRTIRGEFPSTIRRSQEIYGALTAAVWLGRREVVARAGAEPPATTPIVVDPRREQVRTARIAAYRSADSVEQAARRRARTVRSRIRTARGIPDVR